MKLRFPGVSPPFLGETLLSLIQRIGQRHDLTFSKFRALFDTIHNTDMDLCMTADQLDEFGHRCNLPLHTLSFIRDSCCRFVAMPKLRTLLLQPNRDGLSYRFCPHCWREDQTPYLRLDWKLRDITYCRTHQILLKTRCHTCFNPLTMHRAILGGASWPPPAANLAVCVHCRSDLCKAPAGNTNQGSPPNWRQIHFQNTIVSAILNGHFLTEAGGVRRSVDDLPAYLAALKKLGGNIFISLLGSLSPDEIAFLTTEFADVVQRSRWFNPSHTTKGFPTSLKFKLWLQSSGRTPPKVQS
ncbi:TniQ family protein [Herbaspirillum aquaticum]|uniref:TniQ family protein n=1 Tax=Herbaspirillum aquaticum TaxID=568783 RepID=UPI003D7A392E